jgi:hypothetical protein
MHKQLRLQRQSRGGSDIVAVQNTKRISETNRTNTHKTAANKIAFTCPDVAEKIVYHKKKKAARVVCNDSNSRLHYIQLRRAKHPSAQPSDFAYFAKSSHADPVSQARGQGT